MIAIENKRALVIKVNMGVGHVIAIEDKRAFVIKVNMMLVIVNEIFFKIQLK